MTARLWSRGPDDCGYYVEGPVAIGMRRLAIIDLQTGQQPIANEDESVWVVQNGEIYNYRQLRQQLQRRGHKFKTQSDTEVLVHLYEEHGERFVDHINGMFAVAVWDERRRQLVLVRDRAGQKPLYWTRLGERGIAFASEPKALLVHPQVAATLDLASLCRYLWYEYVPAPHSIYEGIYKLPASWRLVYRDGQVECSPYWELPACASEVEIDLATAAERFWQLLVRSVRLRLASDVPLGVFLSGGLDSTTVLAAMTESVPAKNIKTFTIGFDDPSFDESGYARVVADHFGTDHHEQVFSVGELLELLPAVADYLDEPFADASVLPMLLLSRFARRYVTVALGGDGGDELLAGYPTFQATGPAAVIRSLPRFARNTLRSLAQALPVSHANFSFDFKVKKFVEGADAPTAALAHQLWLGSFSPASQRELLSPQVLDAVEPQTLIDEHCQLAQQLDGTDTVDRLIRLYVRTYLAEDILTKGDRASMATSLELRAPLLDPDLIRFLMWLPSRYKLYCGRTKRVLRRAVRGRIPDAVLRRGKKGFGIPVARWLTNELRDLVAQMLDRDRLYAQGLFNPTAVWRLVEEHWAGQKDNRKCIWTLIMFQLWYDRYLR